MARKAAATFASGSAAGATSVVDSLRSLVHDLFHPYRPELHYMRGPGPAWHAKHDPASAQAPVAASALRQAAA